MSGPLKPCVIVTVRGLAGSHVKDIGKELIRLAAAWGTGVECDVNGVRLLAFPGTPLKEIEREYTECLARAHD